MRIVVSTTNERRIIDSLPSLVDDGHVLSSNAADSQLALVRAMRFLMKELPATVDLDILSATWRQSRRSASLFAENLLSDLRKASAHPDHGATAAELLGRITSDPPTHVAVAVRTEVSVWNENEPLPPMSEPESVDTIAQASEGIVVLYALMRDVHAKLVYAGRDQAEMTRAIHAYRRIAQSLDRASSQRSQHQAP
jgi:hypothetical protein